MKLTACSDRAEARKELLMIALGIRRAYAAAYADIEKYSERYYARAAFPHSKPVTPKSIQGVSNAGSPLSSQR